MKKLLAIEKNKPGKRALLFIFLLTAASLIMPVFAGDSQLLRKTNVTATFKGGSLDQAIGQLQRTTRVPFAYDKQLLSSYQVAGFSVKKESLEKVLEKLLYNKSLNYQEVNRIIVISKKTTQPVTASPATRETMVSGVVTDENNKPMQGVTVGINGTATMTNTDAAGKYKILVDNAGAELVFSYIGYATERVLVAGKTAINVQLKPGVNKELAEVAVVGFGAQRKVSLVGAQSTVNVAELQQPVGNVTTMLAGRVAGVIGVQRSGEPGKSGADIWIRGISTFGGNSSSPLILVDGVERSIDNIDPEDIESFTILKDASGTAVYGVRGANGVIIVKTKTGKVGKPQILFDYNEGVNTFTKTPDMLDGISYMNLVNEARTTRNQSALYSQDYIDKTKAGNEPYLYPNVDWMDAVFNKYGHTRKANLSASGGVDNAQYYVSLGYFNESSFLKTDDLEQYNSSLKYNRYNVTTKLNLKLTRSTKMEVGVQGYFSNKNAPSMDPSTIFSSAMEIPPVVYPVMYPGGFVPGISPNGGSRNPYADLTTRGYKNEFKNQLYANLRLTQDLGYFVKGLSASAMFAFDSYNEQFINRTKRKDTYIVDLTDPYKADGTLNLNRTWTSNTPYLGYERSNGGNRQFYTEASLTYDRTFGRHRVSGLGLFYSMDKTNAFANDFTTSIPERTIGLAGRTTYSYDDRYFAEFNFGYNGSELFAPENRFGFFPAVGVGWVVSNERFFEPLKNIVSFLKFRYSNGNTGLGLINGRRFAYLTLVSDGAWGYDFGRNSTTNTGGIAVTDYATNVKWSQSNKQDVGVEIKLLNDQVSLMVDLFKEHRTGIFLQRQSSLIFMGLQKPLWGNLGVADNKGFDATLEYNTHIGQVYVNVRGNITFSQDKVLQDDMLPQAYPWMEHKGNNILARYGYVAEKLFVDQKEINENPVPGDKTKVLPGDIKYKDLNGDGVIDAFDKTKIGRGDVPSTVYGFGFNITYKNFSVGALFQGIDNADRMLSGAAILPFNSTDGSNAYSIAADRWTVQNPNTHAFYPRLAYGSDMNANNTQPSSWWVKDVSFMRLKTAQLAYKLPGSLLSRAGVKNASIYLQGINLLTFSKFKLWDPELNTDNGTSYPNVRTVALGVNLKF
jgi:TonB-linked SusC/RagA family outer membrane protein